MVVHNLFTTETRPQNRNAYNQDKAREACLFWYHNVMLGSHSYEIMINVQLGLTVNYELAHVHGQLLSLFILKN